MSGPSGPAAWLRAMRPARSQSTTSVRVPESASDEATPSATLVLPAPRRGLVKAKARMPVAVA